MKTFRSAESILAAIAPKITKKTVEGLGEIYLRSYPETLLTRRRYEYGGKDVDDPEYRIVQIVDLVVDENGEPLFKTEEQIEALRVADGFLVDKFSDAVDEFLTEEEKKSEDGSNE